MKKRHIIAAAAVVAIGASVAFTKGPQTGCQAVHANPKDPQAYLQDKVCTPGLANPELTKDKICSPSFRTGPYRNVPDSEKNQVYGEYGITSHPLGSYEIDHLISIELGGSNDIKNLWPEPKFPNEKDPVENKTHKLVCEGKITLQDAQQKISTNWIQLATEEATLLK